MSKNLLSWVAAAGCVAGALWFIKNEARTIQAEAVKVASQAVDDAGDRVAGRIVREAGSVVATAAGTPVSGAKLEPPINLNDWITVAHRATEVLDRVGDGVAGLTDDEERLLGEKIHRSLKKTLKFDPDPSTNERVKRLLAPLLDVRRRDAIAIQVMIVDSREVNAFSHAGGYLYIHRGLIDLGLSDGELQFVIGHELAHVDLRHCARAMSYAHRADEVLGHAASVVVGHAYKAMSLGYSEEQEFAADAWAWEAINRIGGSTGDAATCLRRMDLAASQGKPGKTTSPTRTNRDRGDLIASLEDHFASHPHTDQRVARLDNLAARKSVPTPSR